MASLHKSLRSRIVYVLPTFREVAFLMIRRWLERLDPRYLRPCIYVVVAALTAFCGGLLIWHSWGLLGVVWDVICLAFEPLIYGGMICYLLQPPVRFFTDLLARREKLADQEFRRHQFAIILTIGSLVLVLVAIIVMALLMVTHSIAGINRESLATMLNGAQGNVVEFLKSMGDKLTSLGINFGGADSLTTFMSDASAIITLIMLSAVFGIYFLIDGDRATLFFQRLLRALLGEHASDKVASFIADADAVFSEYVRGQFIDAVAVGFLMSMALLIVGVPFGPLIGICAGVANLIPFTGGIVSYILVVVSCLPDGFTPTLIWGLIAVTVVMFIDGNYISPRFIGKTLTFHPMLVMVALVLGSTMGGVAGMLVAVPLFAFLKLKLDEWVDWRISEQAAASAAAQADADTVGETDAVAAAEADEEAQADEDAAS